VLCQITERQLCTAVADFTYELIAKVYLGACLIITQCWQVTINYWCQHLKLSDASPKSVLTSFDLGINKHPLIACTKAALIPALCTTAAQLTTVNYMGIQTAFCLSDMVCCGKYQSIRWFHHQYRRVCFSSPIHYLPW